MLVDNGRTSLATAQVFVALLTEAAHTYDELVAATGIHKPRLAAWVNANRKQIRVEAWAPDKNGRPFVPRWRWGAGADAPRPGQSIKPADRMRELRARRANEQQGATK
ncbi:hypothetical protein [Comamonas antarctica]|uniref:hypothetical protein n=1 Tax=Comamonas antarctica TaxID=2743470 RepID=UPI0028E2856E|nr:hypothetical protein [Comamonas antarctica]